jgi:hypothetical protein
LSISWLQTLISAFSLGLVAWSFFRGTRVRRAEWLLKIYEKFYESESFRTTRKVLDYDGAKRDELLNALAGGSDEAMLEPFVDYLNFFEFVGSLQKMKQLKSKEIKMMFDYYIQSLSKQERVRDFCQKQGFESVLELMRQYGRSR